MQHLVIRRGHDPNQMQVVVIGVPHCTLLTHRDRFSSQLWSGAPAEFLLGGSADVDI